MTGKNSGFNKPKRRPLTEAITLGVVLNRNGRPNFLPDLKIHPARFCTRNQFMFLVLLTAISLWMWCFQWVPERSLLRLQLQDSRLFALLAAHQPLASSPLKPLMSSRQNFQSHAHSAFKPLSYSYFADWLIDWLTLPLSMVFSLYLLIYLNENWYASNF